MSRIALFDMDGTLFDFEGEIRRALADLRSPDEPDPLDRQFDVLSAAAPAHIRNRIHLIKNQPGFWFGLPKLEAGFALYRQISEAGFDVHILTKGPNRNPQAWAEKVSCIQHHFGRSVAVNIVGQTKGHYYGHLLVDDYPPYVEDWLKHRPRGLVIMPAQPYNADLRHPNVIRYDGTNLDEVLQAVEAVRRRSSRQHWRDCLPESGAKPDV